VDLRGQTVAVVGTGSTAAQVAPAVAGVAKQLYVFQRQPGWIVPKGEHTFTPVERAMLRRPWARRRARALAFFTYERSWVGGQLGRPTSRASLRSEASARSFIAAEFADHPDLQKAVTPDYPFFGKRPVSSSDFYPCLRRDDVELVPHPIVALTANALIDDLGIERPVDVVVLATGFKAAQYLANVDVVGRNGQRLQDAWEGEPSAFLGITVPGFPNFFMLYGPNTNGYAVLFNLERQAIFAVRSILQATRTGTYSVEVRPTFYKTYNRWLTRRLENSSWQVTTNYFRSASGRVVTQWPDGTLLYWLLCATLRRPSSKLNRKKGRV
jgi:cation diffusion facilitator CzcD-associated flavoprotein CzcO